MEDNKEAAAGATTNAQGGGEPQPEQRMLTQQDVDRIVSERLARQKAQYADYDDLKAKAAKLQEFEEAQKTELQKAQERLDKIERERDEAVARSTDRMIRAAFLAESTKAGAMHPGDVYALADVSGVTIDDDGNVQGVDVAVKAVVEAGRVPLNTRPPAPRMDGGAGGGSRSTDHVPTLTDDELKMASRFGITAEAYAKRKAETKADAARR